MEERRRRHDAALRLPRFPIRHRDRDRQRPRPCWIGVCRSRRGAGLLRRHEAALAQRIFDTKMWRPDQPLRVVLIGTDFEVRVWETLLKIPMGRAVSYSDIANKIKNPKASRAVGAAVGRNPVSFVVPCHRALGKGGTLTGYHWGITRKQAMLGWEAGQVGLH